MTHELYLEMFSYQIGTPSYYRNFKVYPLISKTPEKGFPFETLRSIASDAPVRVSEIDSSGTVSRVKIKNRSRKDILIPIGQSIIGAKQNRMVIESALIKKRSTAKIPVKCTEAGRWALRSEHFSPDHTDAPFFLLRSVNRLKRAGTESGYLKYRLQQDIWRQIEVEREHERAYSPTGALKALVDKVKREEQEMNITLPERLQNQEGVIISKNGYILAMQIFRNSDIYAHHHEASIRSLCITGNAPLPEERIKIEDWYWVLASGWRYCKKAINKGNLHIFSADGYSGEVLEYDNRLIHATFTYA